jgi:hypothetical protein
MTTVVAIVPAKDRQDRVADTVAALGSVEGIDRVLVVDDGSTDATTERAREAGAQVLRLGRNRGKGGAVLAGVAATPDADVYVLIDADVGADAAHAGTLLAPVLADEADLTIGVLPAAGRRGGFGMIRRLSSWGIGRASRFDARAPLSGQRAVRAEHLRGLTGAGRFGLEVAMTIDAANAGARVLEVPVPMEHLHTGRTVSGFRHRGAQGVDIVAALWPRLVPRLTRRLLLGAGLVVLLALSVVTTRGFAVNGVPPKGRADHVVIVGVPRLGLSDVVASEMPNLVRIADKGAMGMMTVHTRGGTKSSAAYATLGAGFQVNVAAAYGVAADRKERFEGSPAIDVLERRSGHRPEGQVIVPAIPAIRRSAGAHIDSRPGALGDALHSAGLRTAIVANADTVGSDDLVNPGAPAALAVTSGSGVVDLGDVSHRLVKKNPEVPFGIEFDDAAALGEFRRVVSDAAVTVVDPGETERASSYASSMLNAPAERSMQAALRRTDAFIGLVERNLPANTLLIVASMSPPGRSAELVPIVLAGAGVVPGRLVSPSTNRPDLVTLTDLAPTVLSSLGVAVPPGMIGQPLQYRKGSVDPAALRAANDIVTSRDKAYPTFLDAFVNLQIVLYVIAVIALLRLDTPESVRRIVRWAMLAVVTIPLVTFLVRIVPVLGSFGAGTTVLVIALSILASWFLLRRWRSPLDPLVLVCGLSLALLCVDLALGGPLQVASLLGYTPTAAARFVGIGNAPYAVLAASAVIVASGIVGRAERRRDAWWLAAAVACLAVVADGAPWLGSDVGGILSLIPALGILLFLLAGRRLNWKTLGILAAATLVALGGVIGYEALQPADHRDHIGRFFLGSAGSGSFWTTISRKLSTNLSVLTSSSWSHLLPVIGAFVVTVLLLERGRRHLLPKGSAERAGFIGLLAVAVLGYAANDSGALVAALVFVYLGPYVGLLALAEPVGPDELLAAFPAGRSSDARPAGPVSPGEVAR